MGAALTVGLDDPGRTSPVLVGATPEAVGDELLIVVLGADHPLLGPMRSFHGLADLTVEVPPRQDLAPGASLTQVKWLNRRVRAVGSGAALPVEVWPGLSVRSDVPVVGWRRRRIATSLFGLPVPVRPPQRPHWWSPRARQAAMVGLRTLAAAGPLADAEVAGAIGRSAVYRGEPAPPAIRRAALLVGGAVVLEDGRWAYAGRVAPRDAALIALSRASGCAGHAFSQVVELMIESGWAASSATLMARRHPLADRVGPDRYRILGADRDLFVTA